MNSFSDDSDEEMDICYMLAACIAQEESEKLIFCNFRNTESFYFILACTGL
jgi:hypothetical protein